MTEHHKSHIPFINVFTTQIQAIPTNGAVSFDDFSESYGFEQLSPTTIRSCKSGVYQFYYALLPLLGPSTSRLSSAFALSINGQIQPQTRFGTGFELLPIKTEGPFVFWGILRIPSLAKIQLVNIDADTAILQNDLFSVSTNTAILVLKYIASGS